MAPDPPGRGLGHLQILSPRGALVYRTPPPARMGAGDLLQACHMDPPPVQAMA